ncbi:MAG: 3-deoxy-8-phosphooctulonate synthase, partial [Planctomycetota bacterium]
MLPNVRKVMIDRVPVGGGAPLALMAGPCVMESEKHILTMAESLKGIAERLDLPFIFKASYDKANRTSVDSFRGPGLEEGLKLLNRVKTEFDLPILSDVHTPHDMEAAGEVLDLIQIPAFLSRQTDMLVEAGKTGKAVAVKKGQFLAPADMAAIIGKVESTGNHNLLITERGFSFGYNNLITDMRAFPIIRAMEVPVVFDATHSVQMPGAGGTCSGGDRSYVPTLARAAAGAGIDALFLEVHDDPDHALCDGPNMVPLDELEDLLKQVL